MKGAARCLPGKGKGHSPCESSTTAKSINGQVTFSLAKPKNMISYWGWGNGLQYNLRERLPPDKDINSRETGLKY